VVRGTGAASGSPPSLTVSSAPSVPASRQGDHEYLPPSHSEALLLEAREVARLLGVGRTKVYELIARRELPVISIGRCVRVPVQQLQVWIASHTEMAGGL
jgi:excisionase family DNA binding protein